MSNVTQKDKSPYLLVEEKDLQQSGHVGNPLMPSTSTSATLGSPVAAAVDSSESSSKVGCIVKGMMGHGILAVLSFLSFALIGSIPNINVQSGQVSAEDLLLSNNCTEESGISGKLDFAAFRLLLVVGVLCWLYSCSSLVLGLFKVAVSACLTSKQPRLLVLTDKFSLIVAVCDGLFTVLTFLAFVIAATSMNVPHLLSFKGTEIYFTFETLYDTVDHLGLCPDMDSPLPLVRGSLATMFFAFVAASVSLGLSCDKFYREKMSKGKQHQQLQSFENCL